MFFSAIITALLAFSVDYMSQELVLLRKLAFEIDNFASFIVWVLSSIILAVIAATVGEKICLAAEGTGIAEIKVFLAGVELPNFLS